MQRLNTSAPAAVRWTAVAVLAATALLIAAGLLAPSTSAGEQAPSTPLSEGGGYAWQAPQRHRPHPDRLNLGVTHTQYSVDAWGDESALAAARNVLTATATYQNQHLFGWGALNPEPSPGKVRLVVAGPPDGAHPLHRRHAGPDAVLRAGLDEGRAGR
jgi:hypothetical protein